MSNYLPQIENEFSRGRGLDSRLSPLDWNLAETWEKRGIPLPVALRAIGDVFKESDKPIGSLRYFIPAVEKAFAEWSTGQTGKSADAPIFRKTDFEEIDMQNLSVAAQAAHTNENVQILGAIADNLRSVSNLPEPLASAVVKLRGEILALLDDTAQKQLSGNAIETRLTALSTDFEVSLIVSVSADERQRISDEFKAGYGKVNLMPSVEHRVLIRKLYEKFNLPELTLYAL